MADIELVIKIPKELVNELYDDNYEGVISWYDTTLYRAIKDGTPLPKGHGDLIDADETISEICGNSCGCHLEECGRDSPCYSVTRIKSALTVIEADKEEEK